MNDQTLRQLPIRRILTALFALGIFLSPFAALLYGLDWGMRVMAFALLATAISSLDAAQIADPPRDRQLRIVSVVNTVLAVALVGVDLLN